LTINSTSVGGNIAVTGNVIGTPGAAGGIYQTGTITGANGSNISFTSNNNISQNGAINLAANTSSNSSNVAYDATTGNKTSSIATGLLSVAAGSLSNINYSVLASGSAINVASAVTVPGAVTLDNTYGCSGSGCVPVTGYLNNALTNWNTFVTTGGYGVLVGGNISGTAIIINGINAGGSTVGGGGVMLSAGLTATSGNINLTGVSTTGIGVGNIYASVWGTTPIAANNGAVNKGAAHAKPKNRDLRQKVASLLEQRLAFLVVRLHHFQNFIAGLLVQLLYLSKQAINLFHHGLNYT
jgi:hypothetical protein